MTWERAVCRRSSADKRLETPDPWKSIATFIKRRGFLVRMRAVTQSDGLPSCICCIQSQVLAYLAGYLTVAAEREKVHGYYMGLVQLRTYEFKVLYLTPRTQPQPRLLANRLFAHPPIQYRAQ